MKIRRWFIAMFILTALVCLPGCGASGQMSAADGRTAAPEAEKQIEASETMIYAHIGDQVLEIRPESNSSSAAFVEQLKKNDVTVELHDYGNFEKVGPLGTDLPTNDERITTEPGDLILYQGNQITIYYDTNTWSFTRLGKVQGLSQTKLKAMLGDGDVTVTFSLNRETPKAQGIGEFDFNTHAVLLNSGFLGQRLFR